MPYAGEIFGRGHPTDSRSCRIVSRSGGRAGTDTRVRRHSAHHDCSISRIPRVTGSDLLAALSTAGFAVIPLKGSHHFVRHEDGRTTVVPPHASEMICPGLLHKSCATANSRSRISRNCCSHHQSIFACDRRFGSPERYGIAGLRRHWPPNAEWEMAFAGSPGIHRFPARHSPSQRQFSSEVPPNPSLNAYAGPRVPPRSPIPRQVVIALFLVGRTPRSAADALVGLLLTESASLPIRAPK